MVMLEFRAGVAAGNVVTDDLEMGAAGWVFDSLEGRCFTLRNVSSGSRIFRKNP